VREGAVWINGKRLTESYTRGLSERPDPSLLMGNFKGLPFTVPKDCYFVMGRQSREFSGQPLLGLRPAQRHHRHSRHDLHVTGRAARRLGFWPDSGAFFLPMRNALLHPRIVRWNRIFRTFLALSSSRCWQ